MQSKQSTKQLYIALMATAGFALLWSIPAIFNGYPLVTGDAGSYIRHAFDFQIPADRSPFYGVFLGISSLWSSLWLVVVVQNFLLAFIFYRYVVLLTGSQPLRIYLLLAIITGIGTCVGWVSCYIMPDVFTSMLLLLSILYLLDKSRNRSISVIYLLLIFFCIIVHNSHYLIFLLFITTVLFLSFFLKKIQWLRRHTLQLLGVGVSALIFVCGLHYAKGFGITISPGSHVFLMGRMVETGLLKKYLDANCSGHSFRLCDFSDKLPADFNSFLWQPQSPLYSTGGWDSSKTEYSAIIKGIFRTPELRREFIAMSLASSAHQFREIEIDSFIWSLGEGSSPWTYIKKHLPKDLDYYINSKQTRTGVETGGWQNVHWIFFAISCITALFALSRFKSENEYPLVIAFLIIFLFFCINALVSGALSTVTPRYQNRIFWILPATNFIISLRLLHSLRSREPRNQ